MSVKFFDLNEVGEDYVVGDVHGCLEALKNMLEAVGYDETKDRLFSVGDAIDRGPDSVGAFYFLTQHGRMVSGNHEEFLYLNSSSNWIANGGLWAFEQPDAIIDDMRKIAKQLPKIIVIGKDTDKRVNIVHAEILNNKSGKLATDKDIDKYNFDMYNEAPLVWGRSIIQNPHIYEKEKRKKLSLTICGHTPVSNPKIIAKHLYIDTGAVYNHTKDLDTKLTMVRLSDKKLFSYSMRHKATFEYFLSLP